MTYLLHVNSLRVAAVRGSNTSDAAPSLPLPEAAPAVASALLAPNLKPAASGGGGMDDRAHGARPSAPHIDLASTGSGKGSEPAPATRAWAAGTWPEPESAIELHPHRTCHCGQLRLLYQLGETAGGGQRPPRAKCPPRTQKQNVVVAAAAGACANYKLRIVHCGLSSFLHLVSSATRNSSKCGPHHMVMPWLSCAQWTTTSAVIRQIKWWPSGRASIPASSIDMIPRP